MNSYKEIKPWRLFSGWMSRSESEFWQELLTNKLPWYRPLVFIYGKQHLVPRMSFFLGEKGVSYKYSGTNHYAKGWPSWFLPLLYKINEKCNVEFNGCLLNLYRNGNDKMGWHSDDEAELDLSKSIASLSLGAERDFILKHKTHNSKQLLPLKNGDLLVMLPACQEYWQHSIPIRKKVNNKRINLTFRRYK